DQRGWRIVDPAVMSERTDITSAIEELGVVAIIRLQDPSAVRGVVDALAEGGVRALEVTMTVPRALELIREIAPTLPSGFIFGAGTVVDADTVKRAVDAGAQFIVSPVFRPDVIVAAHQSEVPVMPGCFTATEILNAWDAGADIVKVFPATAVGPGYLKDIRGPLPHVKLMPTGGVSVENVGEWLKAGAVAVGVGSALLDPNAIAAKQYGPIAEKARRMVANVRAARGQ
ncbi:MAG: bifunctional 4-hydroxy-2-oxoglutarate aldolase/2-dehydro-3-deoxy-phosphogluconate aldolase, partial [Vicinamibacterales bacterium]|nr:bifunctional 4-hydroxy-2-oxoglutarate aldolase/2-dehydro-3-deoxy-phosphogluconate aldolase [Vicinamibacterales bacterium]